MNSLWVYFRHRANAPVPLDSSEISSPKKLMVLVDGSEHSNKAFTKGFLKLISLKSTHVYGFSPFDEAGTGHFVHLPHCSDYEPGVLSRAFSFEQSIGRRLHQAASRFWACLFAQHWILVVDQGKNTCKFYVATCQQHKVPNCHQVPDFRLCLHATLYSFFCLGCDFVNSTQRRCLGVCRREGNWYDFHWPKRVISCEENAFGIIFPLHHFQCKMRCCGCQVVINKLFALF